MSTEQILLFVALFTLALALATLGYATHLWREVAALSPKNTIQNMTWPTGAPVVPTSGLFFGPVYSSFDMAHETHFIDSRNLETEEVWTYCSTDSGWSWFDATTGHKALPVVDEDLTCIFRAHLAQNATKKMDEAESEA